jgi:uncharacterized metal-binding protein
MSIRMVIMDFGVHKGAHEDILDTEVHTSVFMRYRNKVHVYAHKHAHIYVPKSSMLMHEHAHIYI